MKIQVGDLVKFKHHMFDGHAHIHLVVEAWTALENNGRGGPSGTIVLHGSGHRIEHRAKNFIVISKGKS
tara:strand:+ start:1554 stop:1760 length:207 start_codon:yes stop_codon:yes gene_type:complete